MLSEEVFEDVIETIGLLITTCHFRWIDSNELLLLFASQDVLQYKLDNTVSVYLVAVLEYVAEDILTLAGNFVTNYGMCQIISQEDIRIAIEADKVSVMCSSVDKCRN